MSSIQYTVATDTHDVEQAIALITRVYREAGYIAKNEESDISAYLRTPATLTFMARAEGVPAGTISVTHDSPNGIPMDDIFKDDVDTFRGDGKILVEVGQFAVDARASVGIRGAKRAIPLSLFRLVLHYGFRKGVNLLCIAVNPVHEFFYRSLGFVQFGETKSYASVSGKPAVPFALDLTELQEKGERGVSRGGFLSDLIATPPDDAVLRQAVMKIETVGGV